MKRVVVLFCIVAAASAVSLSDLAKEEWNAYKLQYNKTYGSEIEDKFRMNIFSENNLKIARHNQLYAQGKISYKLKQNKYGDMLHHEFVQTMNGFMEPTEHSNETGVTFISPANVEIPGTIDWRKSGAVTEVKNQGLCGSCWSFSATGALEGQHFRKSGMLVSLSEQNLIDCSRAYGNHGCKGGWMNNAFNYIKKNKGIDTEKSYAYKGVDNKCRFNRKTVGANDVGFVNVARGDEATLQVAVATVGPVSVAIDANHDSFQFYSHGVYYEKNCSTKNLDHAVLVVGYGTDKQGGDYWLVKNSWGRSWGDQGFIKMARNRNNYCGIASAASYPLV